MTLPSGTPRKRTAEPCARPSTDPSKKTTALRVTSKQGEGTKDERRCHQQANRGQDEAADNFRVCAPAHASAPWLTGVPLSAVPVSPRLRNLWTFGSEHSASSRLGAPVAICVLVSGSRKTLLSPTAKMLGSSCVTITIVAPRLSRSSRIRSSNSQELIGSRPADGSSNNSTSGDSAIARARPARFCIPPLISEGK